MREIRSSAVRKHRTGPPGHGHHDPGRDDQPPRKPWPGGQDDRDRELEVITVDIRAGREAFLPVIQVMPAKLRKWGDPGV